MNSTNTSTGLAIEAVGLTKRFGELLAVDRLDLEVPAGKIFSLLGPNGSGKTTTVRMLATLLQPDGGSASVNGYDIHSQGAKVRASISLTGQFAALDPNLTARENISLMARLRGRSRNEAAQITDALIERFDVSEFAERLVKQLSGGQRRRADLAAGLVETPKLLVLDEPTTGLDPRSRQVVWSTVRELVAEGITLLLTTQYLEEADALADQIVLIDHGREIAKGTPSQLKALVGDQRVDVVAEDSQSFERLVAELEPAGFQLALQPEDRRISIPAPDQIEDLNRVAAAVAATDLPIDEIALRRPTLDDAFIKLTGHPAEGETQPAEEELTA
ncbi:MAG TPA: ATP-binding cassette domain-containing protein [Solirubrobacteraceae bacterium]|jgi:daunorubicin resistance ABC transporter ATP-binding subunit|nr:ATP-binding cassette domain-containing protein [Solirubrobacteraceae bacterium]